MSECDFYFPSKETLAAVISGNKSINLLLLDKTLAAIRRSGFSYSKALVRVDSFRERILREIQEVSDHLPQHQRAVYPWPQAPSQKLLRREP